MKNYKNLFLIICITMLLIFCIEFFEPTIGSKLSSFFTMMTTIVGFVSVFIEMKRSADIDECNFILDTFKHFTGDGNSGISIIFEKLDHLFLSGENTITNDDRKHITQYLQFFEMLSCLIQKDSISIEDIDDLYGYTFFLATNCNIIQEMELNASKDYYEGIFKIYPKWLRYRINKKKSIPFVKTPLIK